MNSSKKSCRSALTTLHLGLDPGRRAVGLGSVSGLGKVGSFGVERPQKNRSAWYWLRLLAWFWGVSFRYVAVLLGSFDLILGWFWG